MIFLSFFIFILFNIHYYLKDNTIWIESNKKEVPIVPYLVNQTRINVIKIGHIRHLIGPTISRSYNYYNGKVNWIS